MVRTLSVRSGISGRQAMRGCAVSTVMSLSVMPYIYIWYFIKEVSSVDTGDILIVEN